MLIVAWETTAACNLSCRYCRACATPSPEPDELSLIEARAFLDSIAPLQPMLILSGGEPLLRPDIFQIIRHAVSLHLRVSLASNGTLISSQIADEIAASGVARVSISLDGADAEKQLIVRSLKEAGGSRTLAARKLGMSRRTLHRKLHSYHLEGF